MQIHSTLFATRRLRAETSCPLKSGNAGHAASARTGADQAEPHRRIIAILTKELRRERARAGQCSYDLGRHIRLNQQLIAQRAALSRSVRA